MDPDFEDRLQKQINPKKVIPRKQLTIFPSTPRHSLGDRFIPQRNQAKWDISFGLASDQTLRYDKQSNNNLDRQNEILDGSNWTSRNNEVERPVYKALLRNELLGTNIDRIKDSFKQDERIPGSPAERKNVLQVSV